MSVEIKIVDNFDNKLLQRKELKLLLTHPKSPTPKKDDVVKQLSTSFNASPKNIIVYDNEGRFGSHMTHAKAKIYHTWEQLEKIERQFVITRKTGVQPKKVARRARKDARKKREKMFGSMRRNLKRAAKKNKD